MRPSAGLVALVIAISSCSEGPSASAVPSEAEAKRAVAARFVYSNSVEFRQVRQGKTGNTVCGEANGKKPDGSKGDWVRFAWQRGQEVTLEGDSYTGTDEQQEALLKADDEILSLTCGAAYEQ